MLEVIGVLALAGLAAGAAFGGCYVVHGVYLAFQSEKKLSVMHRELDNLKDDVADLEDTLPPSEEVLQEILTEFEKPEPAPMDSEKRKLAEKIYKATRGA